MKIKDFDIENFDWTLAITPYQFFEMLRLATERFQYTRLSRTADGTITAKQCTTSGAYVITIYADTTESIKL